MNNKQCLIIEDDSASAFVLKEYLSRLPFFSVAGICKSYTETLEFLFKQPLDLVFLDIELSSDSVNPQLSGLDILTTVPNLPPVIIISNHVNYAAESYRIGKAVDYIVKPFDFERFLIAVNRALNLTMTTKHLADEEYIFLKMGRKFQRFELSHIDYFEAYGIYLKVIVDGVAHVVNDTVSALAERMDTQRFMRVHKSYIINIKKIVGFDHNHLFLQNGKVPIGISYKPHLSGLLRLFDKLEE